jgi:hypothetical protein
MKYGTLNYIDDVTHVYVSFKLQPNCKLKIIDCSHFPPLPALSAFSIWPENAVEWKQSMDSTHESASHRKTLIVYDDNN